MTAINEQKPLELKLGVKGHFKLIKGNGETGEETVVADFDNLVTNQGLDYIMNETRWVQDGSCKVGTGSATPSVTDTQLQKGFARRAWSSYTYSTDSILLTKTITCECTFPVGTFNSTVISEIGSGTNAANYLIGSRALILDDFGMPTTIALLSTEYLRVNYSLILQAPTEDVTGSFNMGSLGTINYTARIGRWLHPSPIDSNAWYGNITPLFGTVYSSDAALGAHTGVPTSTTNWDAFSYDSDVAYSNGSYYRELWLVLGNGTFNSTINRTIGALGVGFIGMPSGAAPFNACYGGFQILLDPYITKLYKLNELYSSITLKMRISIARV